MRSLILKPLLAAIILMALAGCSTNNTKSNLEVSEDMDLQPNLLTAIQRVVESVDKIGLSEPKIASNDRERGDREPISFQELIDYLPPAPEGWAAAKPKGEKNSLGDYSVSQVRQTYTNGDKKITVGIFDWSFGSALSLPFSLANEFSRESTEGYNKGIELDGVPGRAEYTYESRQGSLNLLVDSRFLVQIDGTNIDDSELREWWGLIDLQSLSQTEP